MEKNTPFPPLPRHQAYISSLSTEIFITDKNLSMEFWNGKPHSLIVLFILAIDSNKRINQERHYTSAFYFIFLK